MQRHRIGLINGAFHIDGFPDAVKLIDVSSLVENLPRQLADLVLHHADLQFAQECVQTLSAVEANSPLVMEALWRCAIVHYCKCFGQRDLRATLPYSKIFPAGLPRDVHRYITALRNKHLIHDVNAWTQATPMAVIAPRGKSEKVEDVVCTNITAQTRDAVNVSNLQLLISTALSWVESRIEELCSEIKLELEKTPYDVLLAQPEPSSYYAAVAEDVTKPR